MAKTTVEVFKCDGCGTSMDKEDVNCGTRNNWIGETRRRQVVNSWFSLAWTAQPFNAIDAYECDLCVDCMKKLLREIATELD